MGIVNAHKVFLLGGRNQPYFNRLTTRFGRDRIDLLNTREHLFSRLQNEIPGTVIIDEEKVPDLFSFVDTVFAKNPGLRFVSLVIVTDNQNAVKSRLEELHCNISFFEKSTGENGLDEFIRDSLRPCLNIKLWGVRGSTPCANSQNIEYGGNTSCVQIEIPGTDRFLILDAGTGIRNLGNYIESYSSGPVQGDLFITHPHWDHIQGFPFFSPFYQKENQFTVRLPEQYRGGAREIMSGHLTKTFFPVTLDMFDSALNYITQKEETENLEYGSVDYLVANHPTKTAIYRFKISGYTIIYAPDNELPLTSSPIRFLHRFEEFIRDCDLLIHDAQFDLEIFKKRQGWGHSAWERVLELARKNGVKRLYLTHHDPDSNDEKLDEISSRLQAYRSDSFREIYLAREGVNIALPLEEKKA